MESKKLATVVSLDQACQLGPPPAGNLATPVFQHGTLEAELYSPHNLDTQQPHSRDEIYVVAEGQGKFFDGEKAIAVQAGSFIFVPAGVEHRFINFSDDLKLWVFFYGPEGGEAN